MQKVKSAKIGPRYTKKCKYCGRPGVIPSSKKTGSPKRQRNYCIRCANLKSRYGIDSNTFDKLLEQQGGTCAVCDATMSNNQKSLNVDLNPYTGEVRGLLCKIHHETMLGIGDNIKTLESIVNYLNLKLEE